MEHLATIIAAAQLGAAIAILGGSFTGVGQGFMVAKAIEAMARQPEAKGSINTTLIIGLAMGETNGIYALVIAMILLFANPLMSRFIEIATSGILG